jgi:hypothetical protein
MLSLPLFVCSHIPQIRARQSRVGLSDAHLLVDPFLDFFQLILDLLERYRVRPLSLDRSARDSVRALEGLCRRDGR